MNTLLPASLRSAPPREAGCGAVPGVESFYHFGAAGASGLACSGTACFVASRACNPTSQCDAPEGPRLYCAGRCHAAPVRSGDSSQPVLYSDARQAVVTGAILSGAAPLPDAVVTADHYPGLRKALAMSPTAVIEAVTESGLRGRGGAGFPTGAKWRAAASAVRGERAIVVNADEGDPGAFVDRVLMERDPHRLLEGVLIAAHAVGATRGWIYLRCEYPEAAVALRRAILGARAAGRLGPDALGPGRGFELTVHVGGGSYVCGEETALMRSIEGRRPEVMARPPYATERGVFGMPTVVNNVETLATVPWILEHGADAYRALGFSRSRGTKVFSLNSLFRRPGLHELEFGRSVRELVEGAGGGLRPGSELKGIILGGPLAGILPPGLLDVPLGFEELRAVGAEIGHGGVIAFDQHTSILALMHQVVSFAAYESCGKCTPCRLGARRLERLLARAAQGEPLRDGEGSRLLEALASTSLCGLGTGLAEFLASAVRHYPKEVEPWWT